MRRAGTHGIEIAEVIVAPVLRDTGSSLTIVQNNC
jgi:hypothetical protein